MPETQEPASVYFKGTEVFKVGGCQVTVKKDAEGKLHFEGECLNKAARDELAAVFEEEAILRVNPKVKLDEPPVEEPAGPVKTIQGKTDLPGYKYLEYLNLSVLEEPKPDTRLNPTES